MVRVGETYPGHAGLLHEFRSNLVTGPPGAAERFLVHNLFGVNDLLTAANATHNAAGPGASAGSAGKGYDGLAFTSGTPGASDLTPGTDPEFVDPARNLGTWDLSLGGAGTTAAALARLAADPTLVYSSLMPHVREGFRPTSPAYATAAHDGSTIGAVAFEADEVEDDPPGKAAMVARMLSLLPTINAYNAAHVGAGPR